MSRRACIAAGNAIEQQLCGESRNNVLVVVNINKKLSCRRETARCLVSLKISLSHSRSFKMTHVQIPVSHTVSGIFSVK